MECLIFTQIICHVLDFILLQLITMHLSNIEVNTVRSCCLTHQVLCLILTIRRFPFLEAWLKSTVLIFFLYLLKLHTSLSQYTILVPFLLSIMKLLKVYSGIIMLSVIQLGFKARIEFIRICLHSLHQHFLLQVQDSLLLSYLLSLPPLKHALK